MIWNVMIRWGKICAAVSKSTKHHTVPPLHHMCTITPAVVIASCCASLLDLLFGIALLLLAGLLISSNSMLFALDYIPLNVTLVHRLRRCCTEIARNVETHQVESDAFRTSVADSSCGSRSLSRAARWSIVARLDAGCGGGTCSASARPSMLTPHRAESPREFGMGEKLTQRSN